MSQGFFQFRPAGRISCTAGARASQRGVSLIIAMVMLVVIGFMSVSIMRRATSSDQVAMNNRLQTQANLYAQAALQFCELQTIKSGGPLTVQGNNSPPHWTVAGNWLNNQGGVYRLQAADLPSGNTPAVFPQCIVEAGSAVSNKWFVVTARGYSDDFTADATTGSTKTGSVVWLQSQIGLN